MVDKNQAIINFLNNCPQVQANPLYFNFSEAEDNNKQIVTTANDKAVQKPFIDGSVLKKFTFTIIDYKSIAYRAVAKIAGASDENVEEMGEVQSIIDWVEEQADNKVYPNFGENCLIESMEVLTDNPRLNGTDTNVNPPLAKYSLSIQIQYIDNSKVIWK